MKRRFLLILALLPAFALFAGTPEKADTDAFAAADWHWQDIGRGAQCGFAQIHLFDSEQFISVIRYKARRWKTDIVDAQMSLADSTEALARLHGGIAAINGNYFNMKTLAGTTYIKDAGKRTAPTTASELFRVDGLLALRGKKMDIFRCDTSEYAAVTRRHKEAMAAGPVLLLDGKEAKEQWPESGFFSKRHPRTLVGKTSDGWIYLIVIDGRFPGQGIGTTIHETAMVAHLFGLCDAINLDGGGSSTLWTKETGVLSHPYDNRRFDHYGQRRVPNIILIR